jgi:hypothetical protein
LEDLIIGRVKTKANEGNKDNKSRIESRIMNDLPGTLNSAVPVFRLDIYPNL